MQMSGQKMIFLLSNILKRQTNLSQIEKFSLIIHHELAVTANKAATFHLLTIVEGIQWVMKRGLVVVKAEVSKVLVLV